MSIAQQTTARSRSSLPSFHSPLVGRQSEVPAIQQLLRRPEVRMVTLTGTGGVGKTRLAVEAVAGLAPAFPGGVWMVELGLVTDPARLLPVIASACGIESAPGRSILGYLQAFFDPLPALLLLDNLEQIIESAVAIGELIDACPSVKVLVTSREPLRLLGEHEFSVLPLPLPAGERAEVARIRQADAVQLYLARSAGVLPQGLPGEDILRAVAGICTKLEGLPLAIELVASRIPLASAPAMASRLDHRVSLMTSGMRDAPPRQRTLHDTIAWSYDLLDQPEQELFRRLAVFRGGFSAEVLEITERAQSYGAMVWPHLASLVDKCLLYRREGAGGQPRFAMLETIREFAWARLAESGGQQQAEQDHAEWAFDYARQMFEAIYLNPVKIHWLDRTDDEHDNLRSALHWYESHGASMSWIQFCVWMAPFWFFRSHRQEGSEWLTWTLQRALADDVPAALLGWVHHCLGLVMERKPGAVEHLDRSIELWEPLDLRPEIASSQISLSIEMTAAGNYEKAVEYGLLAAPVFEEFAKLEFLADQYEILSRASIGMGQIEKAQEYSMRGLPLNVMIQDDWSLCGSLTTLSFISVVEGNLEQATEHLIAARQHLRLVKSAERLLGWLLAAGAISAKSGAWAEAALCFGAADQITNALGFRVGLPEESIVEPLRQQTREQLGDLEFEHAYHRGQELPRYALLDLVLTGAPPTAETALSADGVHNAELTSRERDVLRLLAEGLSDQEIADQLFITRATASRHLANVYRKLGVRNRAGAVAYALGRTLP